MGDWSREPSARIMRVEIIMRRAAAAVAFIAVLASASAPPLSSAFQPSSYQRPAIRRIAAAVACAPRRQRHALFSSYETPEEESYDGLEGLDDKAYLASSPGNEVFGSEPVILPEGNEAGASPCVIKVLGVGGGGGNAVNRMIQTRVSGVAFWALNTDAQALSKNYAPNTLNIGRQLTRGLGAGGDPSVGKAAAMENVNDVEHICSGADMIFITAGMGGGTGTGAAPVIADIAKNTCGCLTVGVVTKPFAFEGRRRMKQALEGIEKLRDVVDTLIIVSNDKLLRIVPENTPVTDAFLVADDILRQGVVGVTEIILKAGMVNLDFADIRTVMKDAGTGIMGLGTGVGKMRATDAALAAISSPLLDFPISFARQVIFNVVGSSSMSLDEINAASEVIHENAHEDANIMFGALIDDGMNDEVSVTVVACDFRESSDDDEGGVVVEESSGVANEPARARRTVSSGEESGEWRDPNFYKERRRLTKSPLGPDASLEDTRKAITRGFKMPAEYEAEEEEEEARKGRGVGGKVRGFFGRFRRKKT
uniref:Tubulin/FtsZ GTPase domain-containing protein n=2 Tax=Odontella aurita TaxID=265563 RepID=A0A7S4MD83_9STRA|mmetsp:Transcript_1817/g.4812  ORF Transcript_1817/g.4812 Transcript_1817/m.4812 type:complete len:538 (+) Transcript_1817:414-2027(+)